MEKIPFCVLPWIHSYVDGEGNRALCCIAKPYDNQEEVNQLNLIEYGQWLGKIRKQILVGGIPEECRNCAKGMPFEKQREALNENLKDEYLAVIRQGKENFSPVYLDYRIDNTCNLSCLSCSSHLSSTIARKVEQEGMKEHKVPVQKERFKKEFVETLEKLDFGVIYFASGEPFMSPLHWEILKDLEGREAEFKLFYNSNLTITRHGGQSITEKLKKFKKVDISLSLDSEGAVGEMLRQGLDFEKWKINYEDFFRAGLLQHSKIFCVLSIPALINIKPFLNFCRSIGREVIFTPVMGNAHEILLDPAILDTRTRKLITEDKDYDLSLPEPIAWEELSRSRLRKAIAYYYRLGMEEGGSALLEYYSNGELIRDWFSDLVRYAFIDDDGKIDFEEMVIEFVLKNHIHEIKNIKCMKFNSHDFEIIKRYWPENPDMTIVFEQPSRGILRKFLLRNSSDFLKLRDELNFFELQKNEIEKFHELKIDSLKPKQAEFFKKDGLLQKIIFKLLQALWVFMPSRISMRERWILRFFAREALS